MAETYQDYLARQQERDIIGQPTVDEEQWNRTQLLQKLRRDIDGVQQYQDQQSAQHQANLQAYAQLEQQVNAWNQSKSAEMARQKAAEAQAREAAKNTPKPAAAAPAPVPGAPAPSPAPAQPPAPSGLLGYTTPAYETNRLATKQQLGLLGRMKGM